MLAQMIYPEYRTFLCVRDKKRRKAKAERVSMLKEALINDEETFRCRK